jgi:hypothetical protein
MTEDLRWSNRSDLPEDVCASMRDVLAEALRQAARTEDPGDGSMVTLEAEKTLGRGMWDGGWKLQSSFVEDVRMNEKPFVIVHAYQGSQFTKGSVSANVTRTPDDRRHLAHQRRDSMVRRRDELNIAIDKLTAELDDASPAVVMWGGKPMRYGRCPPGDRCLSCDRLGKHLEPIETETVG